MWKALSLALAWLCLLPGLSRAVDLKHPRFTYGPAGAVRADNKFLAGDVVFMTFDVEGLKIDPKKGKASYVVAYDVVDGQGKVITSKETPQDNYLGLGGSNVPGFLVLQIDAKQPAGSYRVKLKITDRNAKKSAEKVIPFDITAATFGILGATAPAIGIPGQQYQAQFGLANMTLDKKKNEPNVTVSLRVLDEAGKDVAPPLGNKYPEDLAQPQNFQNNNFIGPVPFLIFLNRPGRFVIAVDANDKLANKKVELRIPLYVLDLNNLSAAVSGAK
jgi:hypothetical protein